MLRPSSAVIKQAISNPAIHRKLANKCTQKGKLDDIRRGIATNMELGSYKRITMEIMTLWTSANSPIELVYVSAAFEEFVFLAHI